jgi:5-methylcytosine-specific restriction endonuclease McrA
MISNFPVINRFYRSASWQQARLIKITSAKGRCEKCGGVGEEVHHIIHVTPSNVEDLQVTLNQNNLILLCKDCHNKEHERFTRSYMCFDKQGNLIDSQYKRISDKDTI